MLKELMINIAQIKVCLRVRKRIDPNQVQRKINGKLFSIKLDKKRIKMTIKLLVKKISE